MKIRVKADGHNFALWLPTSLLKGRIGYAIVKRALQGNDDEGEQSRKREVVVTRAQVKEMYAVLRRTIKERGHFNVVDVQTADGEKVLIRV